MPRMPSIPSPTFPSRTSPSMRTTPSMPSMPSMPSTSPDISSRMTVPRFVKKCSKCSREVSSTASVGDSCPYCGVKWSYNSGIGSTGNSRISSRKNSGEAAAVGMVVIGVLLFIGFLFLVAIGVIGFIVFKVFLGKPSRPSYVQTGFPQNYSQSGWKK